LESERRVLGSRLGKTEQHIQEFGAHQSFTTPITLAAAFESMRRPFF
jgi:hypothetical protein